MVWTESVGPAHWTVQQLLASGSRGDLIPPVGTLARSGNGTLPVREFAKFRAKIRGVAPSQIDMKFDQALQLPTPEVCAVLGTNTFIGIRESQLL